MANTLMYFLLCFILNYITKTSSQCTPYNVRITPVSSSQLTVSWDCVFYSNQQFQVSYQLRNKDQCESSSSDWQNTEWSTAYQQALYNLVPYSTYSVQVTARILLGNQYSYRYSVYQNGDTSESEPFVAPQSVTHLTNRASVSQLTFEWNEIPCGSRNGDIRYEYEMTDYNNNPVNNPIYTSMAFSFGKSGVVVASLDCGQNYRFRVAGKTSAGTGPYSYYAAGRTSVTPWPTDPGTVTQMIALVSNTEPSMVVTWREPSYRGCPVINIYQVTFIGRSVLSMCTLVNVHEDTTTTSALSYNFPIRGHYSYTVSVNAVGGTAMSTQHTTSELAPSSPPANIHQTDSTNTTLSFTWDEIPCSDRNGVITGYPYKLIVTADNSVIIDSVASVKIAVIPNLTPGTAYTFSVAGRTSGGTGNYGSFETKTMGGVNPPTDILIDIILSTSITFYWSMAMCVDECPGGSINGYSYRLHKSGKEINSGITDADVRTMTITGLMPCTEYTFSVAGITPSGTGSYNTIESVTTGGEVDSLTVSPQSATALIVSWDVSSQPCTTAVKYVVEYLLTNRDQCLPSVNNERISYNGSVDTNSVTITDLYAYSTYEVFVIAGSTSTTMNGTTNSSKPTGVPDDVKAERITSTSITFVWSQPPCGERNGPITGYTYTFKETGIQTRQAEEVFTSDTSVTFDKLRPSTEYMFSISAITKDGIGPQIVISQQTLKNAVEEGGGGGESFPIAAVAGSVSVIIILIILILVFILIKRRKKKDPPEVVPMKTQRASEPRVDESTYANTSAYQNGHQLYPDLSGIALNLEPNKQPDLAPKAMVLEAAAAIKPETDKQEPSPKTPQSLQRNRPGTVYDDMEPDKSTTLDSPNVHHPKPKKLKPIKVEHLPEYIVKQKANRSQGFRAEFDAIPYTQEFPWDESEKDNNIKKNRYANIAAYDHSRVILDEIIGVPNSDYINASYVKGYNDKIYIASQGPSKGAMSDIWRMAWLQNTTKIVMLTNMVEAGKRKCEKYWTDTKEPFVFPPMKLTHKKTQYFADFVIRDFVLEKDGEEISKGIRQFHFISWPDMGLPEYPTPLINFLRIVNMYNPEGSGLPIIHCSAGVGRTGTYITVDSMLEMAKAEGKIDVQGAVRKLRQDRIKMVQTHGQYEFIYDTVQEALQCGDTAILVTNFRQEYADLTKTVDKKTGNTKLADQFELLESLTYVPTKEQSFAAYSAENVDRNRFPDRVPSERMRPYLNTTGGAGSTNYINAAFIDGYLMKGEYIVTQMPLPHTVEDFWRMVYENKTTSIVMLNGMSHSNPSLGTYWIDSGTLQLTFLTVEFQSTKKYMKEVVGRIFKIYPSDQPKDVITVQQFQFLDWPLGQDIPNSTAPLIAMIELIQEWQNKQRKIVGKKPIIVHCIDGIGVSGVFCALMCMMNRMDAEKAVNVFQSVKRLRMSRPGMVETLEQYNFLYKAAREILEGFDIYENFR